MRRSRCRDGRAAAAAVAVALAAGFALPAQAHDTWLVWRAGAPPGQVWLALGTGETFPQPTSPVRQADLQTAACRSADGRLWPLRAQRVQGAALWLRARVDADAAPERDLVCWAETRPRLLKLSAAEVRAYLQEIRAPAALQARWAADARDGTVWTEEFRKHARIERHGGPGSPARQPSGQALDIVIESTSPAVGRELIVRVLRDGAPLADQALQLLGDKIPLGLWLQTDVEGRARVRLPAAGHWLIRGTDLRPPERPGDPWRSRFMTLAFEVMPP